VAINLRHNTRIQHQNAKIALAGGLDVTKKRGGDPRIAGVIELEQGWAGFQGRRFVLNEGKITFTGGTQINPQLDILAQYKHDDYVIDAVVGGTGEEPSLDLRSDPPLEQADILAVLLFGKPASALGKGEQADLQQQAMSLTSGYAAATIGRSVSDALGLDDLGIDLSDVDFSGGQVGFGRNLSRKTRISATQSVGGKRGQEAAIDYEIAPDLDLRTTTSSTGSSGADIIWRKRY
jgi:translocation and assembly module TamB